MVTLSDCLKLFAVLASMASSSGRSRRTISVELLRYGALNIDQKSRAALLMPSDIHCRLLKFSI